MDCVRRVNSRRVGLFLIYLLPAVMMTTPGPAVSGGSPDLDRTPIPLDYHVPQSEIRPDAEVQLLDLLNRTRRARGLPPLVMDGSLRFVARAHSQDMARRGYFGHVTMSGQSFADRLSSVVREGFVGENVAIAGTAEQANTAFAASPAHLGNMVEPRFHRVGIGVATAGALGMMVTEDFAE